MKWIRVLIGSLLLFVSLPNDGAAQWQEAAEPEARLPAEAKVWEPAIAVGPAGEVLIVGGQRDPLGGSDDFQQHLIAWRSQDGGLTFSDPSLIDGRSAGEHWDQRVSIDSTGTAYISYMEIGDDDRLLRLARSEDGGETFRIVTAADRVSDKPELAVTPYGSDVYIAYELSPTGPSIVGSHDGGDTWETPQLIAAGTEQHFWPEALVVAPNGDLWFAVPSVSRGDLRAGQDTPGILNLFRSQDQGRTWERFDFGSSPRTRRCAHEEVCSLKVPEIDIAVSPEGAIYAVYTEGEAGEPYGLFMRYSEDGGRFWTAPQAISAAPRPASGDLADHYESLVTAGQDGEVCVVWVDDRRGALDVWARCAAEPAGPWGREILLSNQSDGAEYKSRQGFAALFGHYMDAEIGAGRLHAVWGAGTVDRSNGDIWTNVVELSEALSRQE